MPIYYPVATCKEIRRCHGNLQSPRHWWEQPGKHKALETRGVCLSVCPTRVRLECLLGILSGCFEEPVPPQVQGDLR